MAGANPAAPADLPGLLTEYRSGSGPRPATSVHSTLSTRPGAPRRGSDVSQTYSHGLSYLRLAKNAAMNNGPFETSVIDRLLSTTRSVRKRLDLERPVDLDVVVECLRLAVQAPTASNSQNWRWLVLTDPAKRAAVAEFYRQGGQDYLIEQATTSLGQTKRVFDSAVYLLEHLHQVPVLVIPCVLGRPETRSPGQTAALYGSIIPATWSFALALRTRGLGTTWTTLHLRRERQVADLLGIPDDVTQVALLPVAYTIGQDFKPAIRPPVERITFWDNWGESTRPG